MIPDAGLQRIRDLVDGDLENGQAGTDTTLPAVTDTDLLGAVSDTENALTSVTSGNALQTTLVVASTQGNGSDLTEYADFINSGNTLLSRVVVTAISKDNTKEVTKLTTYNFTRGI